MPAPDFGAPVGEVHRARYEVTGAAALAAGGSNDTASRAEPEAGAGIAATTSVGAPGTVIGVIGLDAPEAGPVPTVLDAVTTHVYDTPVVRPVTISGEDEPAAERLVPPAPRHSARYEVIGELPASVGEVNDTLTPAGRSTSTLTPRGAPGVASTTNGLVGEEDALVPTLFVADILQV